MQDNLANNKKNILSLEIILKLHSPSGQKKLKITFPFIFYHLNIRSGLSKRCHGNKNWEDYYLHLIHLKLYATN